MPIFLGCNTNENKSSFSTIEVRAPVNFTSKIFLYEWINTNAVLRDSAINKNGQYTFNVKEKGIYRLNISPSMYKFLVVDTSKLFIELEGNASIAKFSTSDLNTLMFDEVNKAYQENEDSYSNLNSQYILYSNLRNENKMAEIESMIYQQNNTYSQKLKKLIKNSKSNLTKAHASNFLNINDDFEFVDSLYKMMKTSPDTTVPVVKQMLLQVEKHNNLRVGSKAPNFELAGFDGTKISLPDFHGKILYLDFWASWCPPCRAQNPDLVRLYKKYKNYGFEILGVSLDNDLQKWKQAVRDDNLSWYHVSSLEKWDCKVAEMYGVESIPQGFLLDQSGKIIAKGIDATVLENLLVKLTAAPQTIQP